MQLYWAKRAEGDLHRLYEFLHVVAPEVAHKVATGIVAGAEQLLLYPQLGVQMVEYLPRDIRRLIIGDYELRYELNEEKIYILRLWHSREDR